jgi:cytochrome c oxidase assembly factor CtaG
MLQLAIETTSKQFKARHMKKKLLTARQFTKTTMNAWVARICTTGFWLNTIPLFVASVGSRKL